MERGMNKYGSPPPFKSMIQMTVLEKSSTVFDLKQEIEYVILNIE
jgi:hypothetical protein